MAGFELVGYGYVKRGGSWSGGANYGVFESQSWSGGAFYGVFESQSWSGGASVSGISFHPAFGNNESRFGMYFRCTTYPAATTTIYDIDAGPNGYERTALTPSGHVLAEFKNAGVSYSVDLGVLPLNQWCWISTSTAINGADNDALICLSALFNSSGTLIGSDSNSRVNMATNRNTSFTGVLSFGLPGSGSYASAPNDGTMKFSKFRHQNIAGGVWYNPLGSDTTGDLNDYMARQAVGVASTLNDTGSSAQSASAGGQGLTINLDGPYP